MSDAKHTPGEIEARPDPRENGEWELVQPNTNDPSDPWFIAACFEDANGGTAEGNAKRLRLTWNCHDELVAALKSAVGIIENCNVEAGVCCCGDDMQNHANPMDCGHSPVDQGEYSAHLWLVDARAALSRATSPTP